MRFPRKKFQLVQFFIRKSCLREVCDDVNWQKGSYLIVGENSKLFFVCVALNVVNYNFPSVVINF